MDFPDIRAVNPAGENAPDLPVFRGKIAVDSSHDHMQEPASEGPSSPSLSSTMSSMSTSTGTLGRDLPTNSQGKSRDDEAAVKEGSSSLGYRSPSVDLAWSGFQSASPVHPHQHHQHHHQTCQSATAPNNDGIRRDDLRYFEEALLDQIELVIRRTMLEIFSQMKNRETASEDKPSGDMVAGKKRKTSEIYQSASETECDLSSLGSGASISKKRKFGVKDGGNLGSMDVDHE